MAEPGTHAAATPPAMPLEHGTASDAEAPVFAARGALRPRALALAARVIAVLVVLWLVALLAGALGLGRLPGVPFPGAHGDAPRPHAVANPAGRRPPPGALPRTARARARGARAAASDHLRARTP